MSLKLHELSTDAEFAAVCAVETEAFKDPFFGFWHVFYGTSSQEDFCARQLSWHKGDPSSNWIYVTDVETGDVIGGAQWNIYKENPYATETEMLTPYWIPEGAFKDVANQLLRRFLSYRPIRMNEPHICEALSQYNLNHLIQTDIISSRYLVLNFCFTHPKHRRRGVGRLLMEWGARKADELGLVSYIEATDFGLKFYEAQGYKVEGELDLDAIAENPSEEFIRVREELECPVHGWFMRRPKYGKDDV